MNYLVGEIREIGRKEFDEPYLEDRDINNFEKACESVYLLKYDGYKIKNGEPGLDEVERFLENEVGVESRVSSAAANMYVNEVMSGNDPYTALTDSLNSKEFAEIYEESVNTVDELSIGVEYEYAFKEGGLPEDVDVSLFEWRRNDSDFDLVYSEGGPDTVEMCTSPHHSIKAVAHEVEMRKKIAEDKLGSGVLSDKSLMMGGSFPGLHVHVYESEESLPRIIGKVERMKEFTDQALMVYSNAPGSFASIYRPSRPVDVISKRIWFNKEMGMTEESYRYDMSYGTVEHVLPDIPSDRKQLESFLATAVGLQYSVTDFSEVNDFDGGSKTYFADESNYSTVLQGKKTPSDEEIEKFLERIGKGLENAGVPDAEGYVSGVRDEIERNIEEVENLRGY